MKLTIKMDLDNAWFNGVSLDGEEIELDLYAVAGTLRDLADRLAEDSTMRCRTRDRLTIDARDGFGNAVGTLRISGRR